MPVTPVICWKCTECERIYTEEPQYCVCERQVYVEGEQFGPFVIFNKIDRVNIRVKCLLCDSFHVIRYNNIKIQKSCGCLPKHVEIVEIKEQVVTYTCRRCGKTQSAKMPIVMYCCEDENED